VPIRYNDSFVIDEQASEATPPANTVAFYAKADGQLYSKDDAGVETLLGNVAGGAKAFTFFAS
jgi:hypothetical protein